MCVEQVAALHKECDKGMFSDFKEQVAIAIVSRAIVGIAIVGIDKGIFSDVKEQVATQGCSLWRRVVASDIGS